jgi:purine-binding chemotaxis protein CheW
MGHRQLCTFRVDGLHVAVDARQVREVVRAQEFTRVPLAPPSVHGLMNLRGEIVTAIDLRSRLSLPPRPSDDALMGVVLVGEHGAISLLVDEAMDVFELGDEGLEAPPETLRGTSRALILGVYKLPDRLLLLLDLERTIDVVTEAADEGGGRENPRSR